MNQPSTGLSWLPSWPPSWPEIRASVEQILASGDWGRYQAETRDLLTARLKKRFGVPHLHLTCSGTASIELALRAAKVTAGDHVVVAAFDYPGNLRCVEALGALPVLGDVEAGLASLCPHSLQGIADSGQTERIRAVIVSHLFGQPASIDAIAEICQQQNWILIEDACQVPGMKMQGRLAGSVGDIGVLSFGGSKPLTAGNGGAVLACSNAHHARLTSLLERPSDAFPMSPLQAAALLPQIDRLDECVRHRSNTVDQLLHAIEIPDVIRRTTTADPNSVVPSYYKLAWLVSEHQDRAEYLDRADRLGLPIGPGFRSMHRSSPKRCIKPVPLERSALLGERCVVLDHRALLVESQHLDTLISRMRKLDA